MSSPYDLPEPGEEVCVTVRAYDVWGAAAEPTTACLQTEAAPDVYCADPEDNPNNCPTEPPLLPPPDDDDSGSSSTGEPPAQQGEGTTGETPTSGPELDAEDDLPPAGCRAAQPSHLWWLLMVAGLWRRRKHPLAS